MAGEYEAAFPVDGPVEDRLPGPFRAEARILCDLDIVKPDGPAGTVR
jgi:hypothetical protein